MDHLGRIVLSINQLNFDGSIEYGVCRIAPLNGNVEIFTEVMEDKTYGFTLRSPNGRYWLKQDRSQFPMRKDEETGEVFFGIRLQLWEVFPLHYVRSFLVEWRKLSAFDSTHHGFDMEKRLEAFNEITKAAKEADVSPTGKAFAPRVHMNNVNWETDGEAFIWQSFPDKYRVTLSGTYEKIGSKKETQHSIKDRNSHQKKLETKIQKLILDVSTFTFVLPSLSTNDCIAAIQSFSHRMDVNLVNNTRDVDDIEVKFVHMKKQLFSTKPVDLTHAEFFTMLGKKHPKTAPALVMLIEKYVECIRPHKYSTIYVHDNEGEGFMHEPAMALLQFEGNYLSLLRAYGATVDHNHEWKFKEELIPAAINKYEHTTKVTEFTLWAIMFVIDALNEEHLWAGQSFIQALSKRSVEEITELALSIAKYPEFYGGQSGIANLNRWLISQNPLPNTWRARFLKSISRHITT